MPNVNIPETKTIALVRTCQEKGRRQLIKKMMDVVIPGKRRRGRPRVRWTDNNREDMTRKMMVKTGPQRSGDGL